MVGITGSVGYCLWAMLSAGRSEVAINGVLGFVSGMIGWLSTR